MLTSEIFKSLLLAQGKIDKFKTSMDEKFTIEQVITDRGVLSTTLGTLQNSHFILFCDTSMIIYNSSQYIFFSIEMLTALSIQFPAIGTCL